MWPFRQRSTDLSDRELLVLSKDDCSLCDKALIAVEELRRGHRFQLRVIKIEPGDAWYEQYWDKIPVGLLDGRMVFKYRVDPDDLLEKIRTAPRSRSEKETGG